MNANELRIGNWLKRLDDTFFQVKASDILDISSWKVEYLKPEPIHLTEEILLKCGYISVEDSFIHPDLRYSDLFKIREDGGVAYVSRGVFIANTEYLHELQNLHFILTGEELTINL